jgi:hypothetical protein
VVVVVGVLVLWPGPSQFTWENVNRIRKGMSRADVEAILGSPGDYTGGPVRMVENNNTLDTLADPGLLVTLGSRSLWVSDVAGVEVAFDTRDRVWLVDYRPLVPAPRSYFANLLWRLKRQWHRWFP